MNYNELGGDEMDLRKLRDEHKMTQSEVARKVGVSLMSYQLWERGVMNPSEQNKEKLEKLFKVNK